MLNLSWVLLAISTVGLSPINQVASDAHARAEQGLQMAQKGDLQGAETELRRAVDLAPADAFCLASLGSVLGMEHQLEESSRYLEKALQINPSDAASRRNLASNQYQLGQLKPARENLQHVLKALPGDPMTLLLSGMVSEELKEYAGAIGYLNSVPELVRERSNSIVALARAYYSLAQQPMARQTLQMLQSPPFNPEDLFLGGQVALQANDFEAADRLFASIEGRFQDTGRLNYQRALILYRTSRLDECQNLLQRMIAASQSNGDLYNLQAWCFYKKGELKKAVVAMDQAVDLEPQSVTHYLDLGKILADHQAYKVALVAAQKALAIAPSSVEAYLLKGLAEYKLGIFADAAESYRKAIRLNAASPEALLGLALTLAASGPKQDTISSFESGLKRFPQDARFCQEYGGYLLDPANAGDPQTEARAVVLLKKAITLDSLLAAPHIKLGNLALAKGQAREAVLHLEAAARLDPKNARVFYSLSRVYRRLGRTEDALKALKIHEKLKAQEEVSTRTATE
jgi:tetratricopeptide (TPR) repeat protein